MDPQPTQPPPAPAATPQPSLAPQPKPPDPASPAKPGRKRLFIRLGLGLLIIIILAAITGLAYYFGAQRSAPVPSPTPAPSATPQPSPTPITTNWRTYTDQTNGYSFDYPSNWQVIQLPDTNGNLVLKSPDYQPITTGSTEYMGEIYLLLFQNPNNLSIQAVYDNFSDTSRLWFQNFPYQQLTTPLEGYKFPLIQESGQTYQRTDYVYKLNGKVIDLNYIYNTPTVMTEFDQIAASVKIIPTSATNNIVYTNSQYGFSLTLPQTWGGYTTSSDPGPNPRIVHLTVPSPIVGAQPFTTLNIYLFTKAEWAALGKKPQYITENASYIFATDQYITSASECVQLDDFQCARALEIPAVITTFKLN